MRRPWQNPPKVTFNLSRPYINVTFVRRFIWLKMRFQSPAKLNIAQGRGCIQKITVWIPNRISLGKFSLISRQSVFKKTFV